MASINGKKINNSGIYNVKDIVAAGFDPKTGLPIKMGNAECQLEESIKLQLRILDEQNAVNRYVWYNLPSGLDGQLLERILYYRGQGMFFYFEADNNFYFLPYTLDGNIDVYGRYKGVTPCTFNGGTDAKDLNKPWIGGLTFNPVYNMEDVVIGNTDATRSCVLLNDYSKQYSETILSRSLVQEPLLATMAEVFPMARTSLIANSGVKGVRVNNQDEQSNVQAASMSIANAAKTGNPWVPIVGSIDFQDLTNGTALKSEEYLLMMQALDNYRLSLYGLKNGGLFQKKSHMLESEQQMNDGNVGLVYQDGLTLRQNFCNMVNSIWDLNIWCEPSECVVGMDVNGDMTISDNQLPTGNDNQQMEEQE